MFHAKSGRFPTWADSDQQIRLGRQELPWLKTLPAQACQQVLRSYRRGWENYWGGTHAKPTYKKRRGYRRAIDIPQWSAIGWRRHNAKYASVQVPLVGRVKVRVHQELPDKPSGARLIEASPGVWELVVRGKTLVDTTAPTNRADLVGVDLGVAQSVTVSNGDTYCQPPTLSKTESLRLYRLERHAARQWQAHRKGTPVSNRLRKTWVDIAALKARQARRRHNFAHQTSHVLAQSAQVVAFEKLAIKNMIRSAKGTKENPGKNVSAKSGLNREILNQGWADLISKTKYKTETWGGGVVRVPPQYTSQTCHQCGYCSSNNRDSQAKFNCKNPHCGWNGNADYNAALNIKQLATPGPEQSWQDVEPIATRQAKKRQNLTLAA